MIIFKFSLWKFNILRMQSCFNLWWRNNIFQMIYFSLWVKILLTNYVMYGWLFSIFYSLGRDRGWMVLRREFDVVFWSSDRFIIRITLEDNQGPSYNNRSGSLCSILNYPAFPRHRSLSINELKIIMIEKPALKAENPVINSRSLYTVSWNFYTYLLTNF